MRKIRLDLGALKVESFATNEVVGSGTVRGHGSDDGTCESLYLYGVDGCAGGGGTQVPCGGGATCSCSPQTCVATCFNSCATCLLQYTCQGGPTCGSSCECPGQPYTAVMSCAGNPYCTL